MNVQIFKRLPELGALCGLLLIAAGFFILTNPLTVPPAVLMIGFVILFAIAYCILSLLFRTTGLKERWSGTQARGYLIGGAALPVILLALESLGQLTVRDVITLAVIYGIGYFYMGRMVPARKKD
jgi:hypothetical protein